MTFSLLFFPTKKKTYFFVSNPTCRFDFWKLVGSRKEASFQPGSGPDRAVRAGAHFRSYYVGVSCVHVWVDNVAGLQLHEERSLWTLEKWCRSLVFCHFFFGGGDSNLRSKTPSPSSVDVHKTEKKTIVFGPESRKKKHFNQASSKNVWERTLVKSTQVP